MDKAKIGVIIFSKQDRENNLSAECGNMDEFADLMESALYSLGNISDVEFRKCAEGVRSDVCQYFCNLKSTEDSANQCEKASISDLATIWRTTTEEINFIINQALAYKLQ